MNNEIARLEKALADAQKKSLACAERRHALPAGSSRARVTTANANWARAAEHRDRCSDRLDAARAQFAATSPIDPLAAPDIAVGDVLELGRQTFTVAHVGDFTITLRGKRGGEAALVRNEKNPTLWALCRGTRSEWYRRTDAGAFEAAT